MKNIILILLVLISLQCKSQNPVIALEDWRGERIPNMYLKDINNILTPYEGTWLYTNGTTSLKIVLVKKTMKLWGNRYEDLLIGEYQYIENGVEKMNTLNKINTIYPFEYKHAIAGNTTIKGQRNSPFDEYTPNEIRLDFFFRDNRDGNIEMRKAIINGQDAIQILKVVSPMVISYGQTASNPIVPDGVYTLIKQP